MPRKTFNEGELVDALISRNRWIPATYVRAGIDYRKGWHDVRLEDGRTVEMPSRRIRKPVASGKEGR